MASALMPIVVMMHEAKETQSKSVGLNLSPLPWLSVGASVSMFEPLCRWVEMHLKCPW
jgi:hypothetical protein